MARDHGHTAPPAARPASAVHDVTTLAGEVCVVGAGAGGLGAAITAARLGKRTILLEQDLLLGGTTTNAGVCVWQPGVCYSSLCREVYERAQQAGVGHIARAGLVTGRGMVVKRADPTALYIHTMIRSRPWTAEFSNGYVIGFDPVGYDRIAREMLRETGNCQVLDGTRFTGVELSGPRRVAAVVARNVHGPLRIRAEQFIDCTAEARVAAAAGVPTRRGEDPQSLYDEPSAPTHASHHLNGVTLMYLAGRRPGLERPPDCEDYCAGEVHGSADIAEVPGGDLSVNHCFMMSGDEAEAMGLEAAYAALSRRIWLCWDLARREYDLADYSIVWIAPRLGVREGPRIVGRAVLTEHDIRAGFEGQDHEDIIALASHAMDVHGATSYCIDPPHGPYGIPFRCLQTNEVDNLVVASRGASFSHLAVSSVRLQRTIMELGIAAGKWSAGVSPAPPRERWRDMLRGGELL